MKNRIVRWAIYFIIGVAIGVGISYYNKQNKIDDGVIELSPDMVQNKEIKAPSRSIETTENTTEEIQNITKDSTKSESSDSIAERIAVKINNKEIHEVNQKIDPKDNNEDSKEQVTKDTKETNDTSSEHVPFLTPMSQ